MCGFPGFVRLAGGLPFVSKGGIIWWDANSQDAYPGSEKINIKIGEKTYTKRHTGLAIGFFGLCSNQMQSYSGHLWSRFQLSGSGVIIFISEY